MKTQNTELVEIFKYNLDILSKSKEIGIIYHQLFSLKTDKDIQNELEYLYSLQKGEDVYFKESGKENWFFIWHKSIRQCDYFQNCFQKTEYPLLSKSETSRYHFLFDKFKIAPKNAKETESVKKKFKDEYSEYIKLWEKHRRRFKDDSINGRLDSILWNLIHVDINNEIQTIFERTFIEYELLQKKHKKVIA